MSPHQRSLKKIIKNYRGDELPQQLSHAQTIQLPDYQQRTVNHYVEKIQLLATRHVS